MKYVQWIQTGWCNKRKLKHDIYSIQCFTEFIDLYKYNNNWYKVQTVYDTMTENSVQNSSVRLQNRTQRISLYIIKKFTKVTHIFDIPRDELII